MIIRDGKSTLFWKDSWLYDKPLCILFSDLFKICEQQNITVQQVKNDVREITFTRWLVDNLQKDWHKILRELDYVNVTNERDIVSRKFGINGRFSVKSTYNAMTVNDSGLLPPSKK